MYSYVLDYNIEKSGFNAVSLLLLRNKLDANIQVFCNFTNAGQSLQNYVNAHNLLPAFFEINDIQPFQF